MNIGASANVSFLSISWVKPKGLICPAQGWSIDFALESNVQELDLDIHLQNGLKYYNLPHRVLAAKSIKVLKLEGCNLGVQDLILNCPLMEDFRLKDCDGLKSIMVSTAKLLSLELDCCKDLERIKPIVTTAKSSIASRNFLALFNHCEVLTLVCSISKHRRFLEELDGSWLPPLYDLKHLRVEIGYLVASFKNWRDGCSVVPNWQPVKYTKLVDRLLQLCPHPNTLVIANDHLQMLIEFQYAERAVEDNADCCCRGWLRKCWRHDLKNVTLWRFKHNDQESLVKFFINNGKMLETITVDRKTFKVVQGK
ncbi:hypothetical protein CK203_087800 [Vitis vinifera]|uniref:FBD domain-containing protein n=1 Tax=Vitis vinifera TaxID=29760 RepID=A0A438CVC7_VITVI|nr:hypothetical protein CK203_087800 [Vitis vinifera]